MSEEQREIQQNSDGKNETASYRSIFKATSLFGGVQIFQILILVLRAKIVAVLLGPSGMGLSGLYSSTIALVQSLTSFGIAQSAVRNISHANNTGDTSRLDLVIAVVRRLVWITGFLGLTVLALFSPLFSKTTFGDYQHIIPLICLSVVLLLYQLRTGENTVMQGLRKLKDLASVSILSSFAGLVISIPLYYLWGTKGIVPAIIVDSVVTYFITRFYSRKNTTERVVPSKELFHTEGKSIVAMGLALSVGSLLSVLVSYIMRSSINAIGGLSEVGLYSAGFAILNTYVGMVFTAMGTDFYPRLAAVNDDNDECSKLINQQGETALFIIGPLLLLCLVFLPFIVQLIYSMDFLPVVDYVTYAIAGIILKASSWVIAFVFIAKAEKKLYVVLEICSSFVSLLFSITGYYLFGLKGLGAGFTLSFAAYLIIVYIIAHIRYGFSFTKVFHFVFIIQLGLVLSGTVCVLLFDGWIKYTVGVCIFAISTVYSIIELNKRMKLLDAVKLFINQKRRK